MLDRSISCKLFSLAIPCGTGRLKLEVFFSHVQSVPGKLSNNWPLPKLNHDQPSRGHRICELNHLRSFIWCPFPSSDDAKRSIPQLSQQLKGALTDQTRFSFAMLHSTFTRRKWTVLLFWFLKNDKYRHLTFHVWNDLRRNCGDVHVCVLSFTSGSWFDSCHTQLC